MQVYVLVILCVFFDIVMSSTCSGNLNGLQCRPSLLTVNDYANCSINQRDASVWCNDDPDSYMFTCTNVGHGDWEWVPSPVNLCLKVTSTSTSKLTKATTRTPSVSKVTSTKTTTIQTTSSTTTHKSAILTSSKSSPTTNNAERVSSEETVRPGRTEISTTPSTAVKQTSTVTTETTGPVFTSAEITGKTNTKDNTTFSPSKSTSGNSSSFVVPVVSAFVVSVIALAAVIIFLLWRQRRLKQQKAIGGHSGRSISNRTYEDDRGLDRHVSLLEMRPDNSVDSGYAEISPGKLNIEESPDSVYQTIDNLPEDKTECDNGYGQFKIQTTKFIDNNYSHFAVNHKGKPLSDGTYAHTGNPTNARLKNEDGNETTYNHLEQNAIQIQGIQERLRTKENKVDDDLEYNHATAGQAALEPDNKGDTYSHLNQISQRPQANQQNGSIFLTKTSKPQMDRSKPQKLDSGNDVGRNTFSEYAKCAKILKKRPTPKPVGYEMPAGTANIYLTLESDSTSKPANAQLKVTHQTFEDLESEEELNHQYFILEKPDTDP